MKRPCAKLTALGREKLSAYLNALEALVGSAPDWHHHNGFRWQPLLGIRYDTFDETIDFTHRCFVHELREILQWHRMSH